MASVGTYAPRGIDVSRGVETLARTGYLAKGIVYIAVGVLAARAALSAGAGDSEGSRGAISTMVAQAPLGRVLLALIALDLIGGRCWGMSSGARVRRVAPGEADPAPKAGAGDFSPNRGDGGSWVRSAW